MNNRSLLVVVLMLVVSFTVVVGGCSSGGGGGDGTPAPAATGTIIGKVSSNATGSVIANATITDGTTSATTAADGTYTLNNLAPSSNKVLTITANNHALSSKIAAVTAGNTSRVDVALQPVAASISLASLATAQSLTVANSPAQVNLPANGLVTGAGGAPSMPVTANLTPIDPSSNPQLMPGNFTTSAGTQIESFGAMEVSFKDNSGASLNLASGQSAVIRIPVTAVNQGSAPAVPAPATMPAFYYNSTTGQWVQEGTLTLAGTAPNQYYEGTVTHFSYWNADQVYDTTCITGKVVNSSGAAVAGARVEAQGSGYTGTSTAYTAADGTFTLQVKANAIVIVTASTNDALSNSEIVSTGAAGGACTAITDLTLGAVIGSAGSGSAKVRLTWGADPSDLDSHLTGPDSVAAGTRFHVYYSSRGSLTGNPFAELDVDDTSSFGPEVITIGKFTAGTYRYSIHHFSGTGDFPTSPARVELTLNGSTTIYTPPAAGATILGTGSVWQVFELVVDGSGNATIHTLNTYISSVPGVGAFNVTAPALKGASKPAIADWVW
jgi:hypothetical protein